MSDSGSAPERLFDILIVDDDSGDVLLIEDALIDCRITRRYHTAGDGLAALEFLRTPGHPRPDLVLLDLNMPRMDGRELLSRIEADPVLRSIPVVVLSRSMIAEDVLASYDLRANAYVTKPVELDAFTAAVHQIDRFYLGVARLLHTQN